MLLASRNRHKADEIAAYLGSVFRLQTLDDVPGLPAELPETGRTLEENSAQKALYVWQCTHTDCLADDSGLEVYALGMRPGVDSAHYNGTRSDAANLAKVLAELDSQPDRRARFRCVLTLCVGGTLHQFDGTVEGMLTADPAGAQGFGYDPAFVPDGHTRTFAQMTMEEKNALSHRARALEKLKAFLENYK